MKVYYDKTVPLGLTKTPSFYAVEVKVPVKQVETAIKVRELIAELDALETLVSMPLGASTLADHASEELAKINKPTRRKSNVKLNDSKQSD